MKFKDLHLRIFNGVYWWMLFGVGLVLASLGIWILISPLAWHSTISIVIASGLAFFGFFEIGFLIGNYKIVKQWGLTLIEGVIDLLLAFYLIKFSLLGTTIMPVVIGLWLLFRGSMVINYTTNFKGFKFLDWAWIILTTILIALLPLLFIEGAIIRYVDPLVWTSLCFILSGLFRSYLSLKLRL